MSDFASFNPDALDRYITGNYGEDQFRDQCPDCIDCDGPARCECYCHLEEETDGND